MKLINVLDLMLDYIPISNDKYLFELIIMILFIHSNRI